jgi:hypothetical protein
MSYTDAVVILSLAPECDDIASGILARLALQADAARLLEHASWSLLVAELVAIGGAS